MRHFIYLFDAQHFGQPGCLKCLKVLYKYSWSWSGLSLSTRLVYKTRNVSVSQRLKDKQTGLGHSFWTKSKNGIHENIVTKISLISDDQNDV